MRRLIRLFKGTTPALNWLALIAIILFFIRLLPRELLTAGPATGGDMSSHFWPLECLVKHGFPNGTLRVWSPGNLAGEPLLVHYFPFPFMAMAALSLVMPLATAFNVGTVLALLLFPLCIYFCVKGLGFKSPTPLIATLFGLTFIYSESNSMWGGNTLSTLAGQFAHGYAIDLLLVSVGLLGWEMRTRRSPFWSPLAIAAVATSHGYALFGMPAIAIALVCFIQVGTPWQRFRHVLGAGILGFLLSLWFLYPMVNNSPWTSSFNASWGWKETMNEGFSRILLPSVIALVLIPILWLVFRKTRKHRNLLGRTAVLWLLPSALYAVFYFAAKYLGVVNIRALPQLEVFLVILGGTLFSEWVRLSGGVLWGWLLILPMTALALGWTDHFVLQFPVWAKWNYSGWQNKPLYPQLAALNRSIQGDLSMPRIAYEGNDLSNGAGTPRVFEMLPWFANRATLEGLYIQASILSPAIFQIQALISKTPSCPFWDDPCPHYNLGVVRPKLELMGVSDLILISNETRALADQDPHYVAGPSFAPWYIYHLKETPTLVETFQQKPTPLAPADQKNWKRKFLEWFVKFDGTQPMLIRELPPGVSLDSAVWSDAKDCRPEVHADFNELTLRTPCPGKAHVLKFGYHPTWQADSGDPLFLVSPGFIGIIPSKTEVHLRFGKSVTWQVATWISILTLFGLLSSAIFRRKSRTGSAR